MQKEQKIKRTAKKKERKTNTDTERNNRDKPPLSTRFADASTTSSPRPVRRSARTSTHAHRLACHLMAVVVFGRPKQSSRYVGARSTYEHSMYMYVYVCTCWNANPQPMAVYTHGRHIIYAHV